MNTSVQDILVSPRLPEIVDELQSRLAAETAQRKKFYAEITEGVKMEFINGRVIMHSPAKVKHLEARERIARLLSFFVDAHRLGKVFSEKALCVFPRNDYEPDVCFFSSDKAASLQPDQLKLPIPDFIAEVLSESTAATDRGQKFEDYQAHGVREYWIVDPDQQVLEQYLLADERYELALKSGSGEVRSQVVPGFCIPIRAIFEADANLQTLRDLLG